jgi:hypothetical protein
MRVTGESVESAAARAAALIVLAWALVFAPWANTHAHGASSAQSASALSPAASAHSLVSGAATRDARAGAGVIVAVLSEQDLPAAEMPSPAATPDSAGASVPNAAGAAAAPGPGASSQAPAQDGGAGDDWTRVPAGGGESAGQAGSLPPAAAGAAAGSGAMSGTQELVVPEAQAPAAAGAPAEGAPPADSGVPAAGVPGAVGANGAGGAPDTTGSTGMGVAGAAAPEASPAEVPPPYDVGSVQPSPPVSDQPLTALIDGADKDQPALSASLRFVETARQALDVSKADDAIRGLGRAVSIDPSDPYAYFYLGRAYMMKHDYAQALAFFSRSEVGLRGIPAWLGEVKSFEGACLEQQGKFPEAVQAYKDALEAAPNNLMARVGYGRLTTVASDANAGNEPPPPAPAVGAALPPPAPGAATPPPEDGTAVTEPPDEPPPAPAQSSSGPSEQTSDPPADN